MDRQAILFWVLSGCGVMSLLAFLAFGLDKWKANHGAWRISERTLMLLAALGGAVGALLGMRAFRHKTQKPLFRWGVPLLLAAQAALLVWLFVRGI